MNCWLLSLLLTTPVRDLGPGEFEVRPAQLAWEDLSPRMFDRGWTLPARRTTPGPDLLAAMRDLLTLRFDIECADGTRYQCFGDLVAAVQTLDPQARRAWYAGLERAAPELMAARGEDFQQLWFDERLHSARWKPAEEHPHDGLLEAEPWSLDAEGSAPWTAVRGRPLLEQSAALLRADLACIKALENDYRTYPDNVGSDYEEIFPIAGSYFVGADVAGRPFSTLSLQFRCDLPFPFSSYTTHLGILNHFDEAEVLTTDIYSTSKDFHWLAGRDVFLPVETSQGEWVAFLLVRHFGFDLSAVPDGSDNRREALRTSLGNLKRNAEGRFRELGGSLDQPRNDPEILNEVRVFGRDPLDPR